MREIKLESLGDILLFSKKIARYLLSHIYQKRIYTVCDKAIEWGNANIPANVCNIKYRKLDLLDNKAFLILRDADPYLSENDFFTNVAAGHECFIGENADNEVVFYVWTRRYQDRYSKSDRQYTYPVTEKNEIHFFSATTKKEYRRKNIYCCGIAFIEEFFGQLGYNKISCTVQSSNYPAVHALLKNNFINTGKQIKVINLFGLEIRLRNFSIE